MTTQQLISIINFYKKSDLNLLVHKHSKMFGNPADDSLLVEAFSHLMYAKYGEKSKNFVAADFFQLGVAK